MTKKILVAYASVSGSTREVAQAIAEVLAGDGVSVEVQPVNTIMSVADYGAIVLGSSIRVGKWLPEAIDFLEDYQESMAHIPVAYFTTCLTMVNDTKDNRRTVLAYMEPVRHQSPEIEPVGLGLFAGSLDPQRQLFMQVEGPQGDYRDWEAIRAWAAEIRPKLLADYVEPGEPPVLRGAVLSYTDMSGLDLREADLQAADLHQADLQEADLHQASLNWADMNWADMAQANLDKANLIGANLKRANLQQANLSQVILNGADLSGANLREANLSEADLNWVNFGEADLSGANLSGANLGWANLSQANLSGVVLNGTRYNQATQWPTEFSPTAHGGILIESGLH